MEKKRQRRLVLSLAAGLVGACWYQELSIRDLAGGLGIGVGPCRKPLPRGEGLCMVGWLCIVQSLLAYTPGIRAGAILLGLPPLVPVGGYAPATPFLSTIEVFRQSGMTATIKYRGCHFFIAVSISFFKA